MTLRLDPKHLEDDQEQQSLVDVLRTAVSGQLPADATVVVLVGRQGGEMELDTDGDMRTVIGMLGIAKQFAEASVEDLSPQERKELARSTH